MPTMDPGPPTTAEIAEHAVSHWPYRSWYLHCIRGRGRSKQHRTDKGLERTIPIPSVDYCFIDGEVASHESPPPVMVDTETSTVFDHACRRKGADPDILDKLIEDIEVLGHKQIVFKSDQENPVQSELAPLRQEMQLENSLKYHSAANDSVENTVQRVVGLTRVLQDALEANIKQTVEPNTPHQQLLCGSGWQDADGQGTRDDDKQGTGRVR